MQAEPYRILLVEDNDADVYLIRRALESTGLDFTLIVIGDGAEAIAYARRQFTENSRPHAAVLDLNLPKSDGTAVLEALRKNETLVTLPVVIVSSSPSPPAKLEMEKFSVQRFVTKSIDLEEFLSIGGVLSDLLKEEIRKNL